MADLAAQSFAALGGGGAAEAASEGEEGAEAGPEAGAEGGGTCGRWSTCPILTLTLSL